VSNGVYANMMEVSCKSGAGKTICAFPDVCFTPPLTPATPPGVPIPYPNTGMSSDCADGSTSVKIAGAEIMGGATIFDDTGELVLRMSRGNLTVTDRATGVDILFNFDMMRNVMVGRGLADGRFELDSDRPALLDIPRDTRPRDVILRTIECRVPLKVIDSRVEPFTPNCNTP